MAESGRTLSTAVHVLKALEFTAEHPKGVSVKALARALHVSLSSAYSLSNSLRFEGFLEVSAAGSGLYVLGPKVPLLYRSYVESTLQPERLEPFLEELRDRASARAYVALWTKGDLEIAEILGRRGGRELTDLSKGFRGAAHALALGKIYLAEVPEDGWPPYLQTPTFKRFSKFTLTSRNDLRHNLQAVRDRGLALDREEFAEGGCCLAVPVRDPDGRLTAALGISVPTRRFQNQLPTLVRVLRDVGLAASQEIGRLIGDPTPQALAIGAPARGGTP
ncbi:MAG TPA: IclR family transcriptional regulator C-terminal domain-containing protein [Acidimicrobiales bacterium]|nr:IclR family transcriptional regulator C-terminal domain-containing protein [Acidimicrobiales bacterium]